MRKICTIKKSLEIYMTNSAFRWYGNIEDMVPLSDADKRVTSELAGERNIEPGNRGTVTWKDSDPRRWSGNIRIARTSDNTDN